MAAYSIVDWYKNAKRRPAMAVLPPRHVQFWLHRQELGETFVTIDAAGAPLVTALIDDAIVQDNNSNWVIARVEIPWAALVAPGRDRETLDLSCYFGRSGFLIGSCTFPVPTALRGSNIDRVRANASYAQSGLSYVFADGGDVTVGGWALARDIETVPRVWLSGEKAEVQKVKNVLAKKLHWFLPGAEWFGFHATAQLATSPDWLKVEVKTGGPEDAERHAKWHRLGSREGLGPLPPDANIHRVSGNTANQASYLNGGYTNFQSLVEIFAKYGVALERPSVRLLDWGCGCARVGRHILALPNGGERTFGIDIDAGNIDWCTANLPGGRFSVAPLRPPTDLEPGTFDAVFAVSVLSHLREPDAEAWLAEIARLMRPGALAVLTYNGRQAAAANLATLPDSLDELAANGFLDFRRSSSLDGFISDREYYRFVLFTDDHARNMFERHFEVLGIEPACLAGGQNAAVLRKRA